MKPTKKHKKRVRCADCARLFPNKGSRQRHWNTQHYTAPPPPKPPEVALHVNFIDLVENSIRTWGKNLTKEQKKSPGIDDLKLGALFCIIEELREIKAQLKRPKTLS